MILKNQILLIQEIHHDHVSFMISKIEIMKNVYIMYI